MYLLWYHTMPLLIPLVT